MDVSSANRPPAADPPEIATTSLAREVYRSPFKLKDAPTVARNAFSTVTSTGRHYEENKKKLNAC